jgi:hypothetical protein
MSRWWGLWGPVLLLTLKLSAFQATYAALGVRQSIAAQAIGSYALPFFLLLWVVEDARRRRRVPCFDLGLLLAASFPVGVGWYLWWTRRWRGLAVAAAFVGLWVAPYVVAVAAWVVAVVVRR